MTLWKGKPYRQKKDRGYDGERTRKVQKKNFSVVLELLNCVKLIMLIQQYLPNPIHWRIDFTAYKLFLN